MKLCNSFRPFSPACPRASNPSSLSASGAKLGPTHPGRPGDEEPHVKKTMRGKREITEYICKVDQDELGILEDEFDDLKDLFKVPTDGSV